MIAGLLPTPLRTLGSRLSALLASRRLEDDLDDEVRFHLDMLAEELTRRGLCAEDARTEARRQFGSVARVKETYRERRGLPAIESLFQDVRYGARKLLGTPGLTLAALLTLALGIGANVAVWSLVRAVLLRPLPYPQPERIVQLVRPLPTGEAEAQTGLRYLYFRDRLKTVRDIAAWREPIGLDLATPEGVATVQAMSVSPEFFPLFGGHPLAGHVFSREEAVAGGPYLALLGESLWRRRFGGDREIVGRSVRLGGRRVTILGILPASFAVAPPADLFVPLRLGASELGYRVAARLQPGVSLPQANDEAEDIWGDFRRDFPQEVGVSEDSPALEEIQAVRTQFAKPQLQALVGGSSVLLLFTCVHATILVLARASGQERQTALRRALGVPWGRLVRQLVIDSVLLCAAGALIGLLLAALGLPLLLAMAPPGLTAFQDVQVDGLVFVATLAAATLLGTLLGLLPALGWLRRRTAQARWTEGTRSSSARSHALRQGLLVFEAALAMLLVVVAGFLLQIFVRLHVANPGLSLAGTVRQGAGRALQSLSTGRQGCSSDFPLEGFSNPADRARYSFAGSSLPIEPALPVDILDGPAPREQVETHWRYARCEDFATSGIELLSGRGFTPRDLTSFPVAIVNRELARQFFRGESPLGRHLRAFKTGCPIEIVGVATDPRGPGNGDDLAPVLFIPTPSQTFEQSGVVRFPPSWMRHVGLGPESNSVLGTLRPLDKEQPFYFETWEETIGANLVLRFQTLLFATFGVTGLLLAVLGLYVLTASWIGQRSRELAIRLALGCTRRRILGSVAARSTGLALAGVALGLSAARVFTSALAYHLWRGLSPLDPRVVAGVAAVLLSTVAFASLVSAWRALRLEAMASLDR